MFCHLLCSPITVSYPQPLEQQEVTLTMDPPMVTFFLLSVAHVAGQVPRVKKKHPVKTWNKRFNVILTDRNLLTFPFTLAWTFPHASRMGGINVGQGLGMTALTADRGHACGEHRHGSPEGITKNGSHLVLMAPQCHSSSGLTLMTSLL